MDTEKPFLVPLAAAHDYPADLLGNKARNLALCRQKGFIVPDGYCISTESYLTFIRENNLQPKIDYELYRKPFEEMRWEEIWDVSFRIRSAFLRSSFPADLKEKILSELAKWPDQTLFAVRSSAPAEDSSAYSFAGIHESFLNVPREELIEKIKLVWASLWSDRSLLYRKEINLDSRRSAMSVLIQVMEPRPVSGLAFTADPVSGQRDVIIIEVIRGSLDLLVDNIEEPKRFRIEKENARVLPSTGEGEDNYISRAALQRLTGKVLELETIFDQPIDVEWTGTDNAFTVLQVRPITGLVKKREADTERNWYLTLTPGAKALLALTEKIEQELIPELISAIGAFTAEGSIPEEIEQFLARLQARGESYRDWKQIYRNEFIPFAHGIRTFGTYYNDLVKPDDPYAFIRLLKTDELLARDRNHHMEQLAQMLVRSPALKKQIAADLNKWKPDAGLPFLEGSREESSREGRFRKAFFELLSSHMDLFYDHRSLTDDPITVLKTILSLAEARGKKAAADSAIQSEILEKAYLEKAGPERRDEALKWLRIGRLSWKLRDNDNILLGKLENQLLVYMKEGLARLQKEGLLTEVPERIVLEDWEVVLNSLRQQKAPLLTSAAVEHYPSKRADLKPRQLVGQPSSPGTITAKARVIRTVEDFKTVNNGEVLIFDAVQPQMTFIISLAGGIVERRGGMLVHSSIIAREMGIPAVNGVSRATELIETGDLVTVNGDLGLVVIGEPEFNLEKAALP